MGVTNVGIDHILETAFHSGTPARYWYLGLIYGQGSPDLDAADTSAAHPGWVETNVEELALKVGDVGPGGAIRAVRVPPPRPRWQVSAATARIGNPTSARWTNNVAQDWPVYGFLIASGPVQRATTDVLFATLALAAGTRIVPYRDTITVYLTLGVTGA